MELVRFDSGGKALVGTLSVPPQTRSACLVVHGWSTCRAGPHRLLVKLANALAARGVASLRFDIRGRGDSEGEFAGTSLDDMIEDALSAARFLRERLDVPLSAFGLCSGGNVAIGAAARADFERIVGVSTLPFQEKHTRRGRLRKIAARMRLLARKALMPSTWLRFFKGEVNVGRVARGAVGGEGSTGLKRSSRDLVAEFSLYVGSVLFIYGGADAEGRSARTHYEEFCAEKGLDASFRAVEGSNHNFYSLAWEARLLDEAIRFLARKTA